MEICDGLSPAEKLVESDLKEFKSNNQRLNFTNLIPSLLFFIFSFHTLKGKAIPSDSTRERNLYLFSFLSFAWLSFFLSIPVCKWSKWKAFSLGLT